MSAEYGSVRDGASEDEAAGYFRNAPPPQGIEENEAAMGAFVAKHKANGTPIVCITSGGTTVPMEKNTVRFIDNFSTGSRGALSAEYFLRQGYAVLFLTRETSRQPFASVHYSTSTLLEMMSVDEDGNISVDGEGAEDLAALIKEYKQACDDELLLKVNFTTVHDYMYLLRSASTALNSAGRLGMLYLAAAVSDFYVPFDAMAEHKMQSSAGPPTITLVDSPKMLRPLRDSWASQSFVVTFKLETDDTILEKKAIGSIEKYGMNVVIANLLATYRDQVHFITAGQGQVTIDREGSCIEEQMIAELVKLHQSFIVEDPIWDQFGQ